MSSINFKKNSSWQSEFTFDHVNCLIVCRGPIRLETMKVLKELGANYGILLSEKDSIVYPHAIAPELRAISNRRRQVHHIQDYVGTTREERLDRIFQIIKICKKNDYTHLFAGYGFMAEDSEFVKLIENEGISFVGPNSSVIKQAGSKDEAKKLARLLNVPVTPGEDQIAAKTLLKTAGNTPVEYFRKQIKKHGLLVDDNWEDLKSLEQSEIILQASYAKNVDLFTISALQDETLNTVESLWQKFPGKRIRLKHVSGGGGKGQRVVSKIDEVADAVMSVLLESNASRPGDNKNFLIELNFENTRHNEIQLIGNGEWCIELGGRDCSLQMHEQKLLEVSLTEEMLEAVANEYESAGKQEQAKVIYKDLKILHSMCKQAERFGKALKLDSVSTFECIVEGYNHYFMEVNTRIQVEHRVTEMVYQLEFSNPDNPEDKFTVESLVALMILLNCYGKKLNCPKKIPRFISGIEARLNATNEALKPHAGGIISSWTLPDENEQRDDQGIGISNPDTGILQPYKLAGAYDSNVALSITHGDSRKESFEKLAEILRCMEFKGSDLYLNVDFQYSLLHWMLSNDPMVKPNTRFVSSYLALSGKLKILCDKVNLDFAWNIHREKIQSDFGAEGLQICDQKFTLILRPLKILFERPHLLMGWLAFIKSKSYESILSNKVNLIKILLELYNFLHLEQRSGFPSSEQIWSNDQTLIDSANSFYKILESQLNKNIKTWPQLTKLLKETKSTVPSGFLKDQECWERTIRGHYAHQMSLELLQLPEIIGNEAGYYELKGDNSLEIDVPEMLNLPNKIEEFVAGLDPTPSTRKNEILAWTGGTFYSRETPEAKEYVLEGQHVEKGDVIGILEVMKMFNQIRAEFSGTIQKICVSANSGIIVSRGQKLFEIEPDVPAVSEPEEEKFIKQKEYTVMLMKRIVPLI